MGDEVTLRKKYENDDQREECDYFNDYGDEYYDKDDEDGNDYDPTPQPTTTTTTTMTMMMMITKTNIKATNIKPRVLFSRARHILEAGGSAVDAAVAAGVCVGVVNIHNSGVGGGHFITIFDT